MKKILTLSALIITGALLAGCTQPKDNTTDVLTSYSTDMMSGHSEIHTTDDKDMMMMHTVDSEEDFIVNMIPHHQEAVDSAKIILERSTDTELKTLAQAIVDAQTKEISMMQGRMSSRYPNSSLQDSYVAMMPDMTTLTGEDLDKAFLAGMIMHHQGAIQMAQQVLKVEHRDEVMTLAQNIISSQSKEISEMEVMLQD